MREKQEQSDLPVDLVRLSFVDSKSDRTEEFEYEVLSDAYVTGTGICGSTVLNLVEFSDEPGSGRSRRYNLKMVYTVDDDDSLDEQDAERILRQETGLRVEDELLSLASVLARRRFWVNALTREEDRPMYDPRAKAISRLQPRAGGTLAGLDKLIRGLADLPPRAQRAAVTAAGFYRQALLTQMQDGTTGYVLLVSAIEVLANYAKSSNALEDFLGPNILKALNQVEDAKAKKVLTEHFHQVGGSTAAFWKTIVALTPDEYYHPSPPYERGWIKRGEIGHFAKKIYRARSKLLHEGRPFDEDVLEPMHTDEPDFYPGVRIMRGKQKESMQKEDRLPQFHALERLVHYLVLEFIQRKGEVDFSTVAS